MKRWLGRYQLGTHLPLVLQCCGGNSAPDQPQDCPYVTVLTSAGQVQHRMAADEQDRRTGLFRFPLLLDSSFTAAGIYTIFYNWLDSGGTPRAKVEMVTIIPGGDDVGACVAARAVPRPDAVYLLRETDAGKIIQGKNPR